MKTLPILISCVGGLCVGCGQKAEPTFQINPNVPRPVLSAFGEPFLPDYAAQKTNHIYRFTCLRSFNEPFCVVLIVERDGAGSYVRKMTNHRRQRTRPGRCDCIPRQRGRAAAAER